MNKDRDNPAAQPPGDTMTQVHHAWTYLCLSTVSASILTAFCDTSLFLAMLTAITWALVGLHSAYYFAHRWDICSLCDQPPRRVATPEARLRLARTLHSRRARWFMRMFLLAGLAVCLAPKPGAGQWWGRLILTGECLVFAGVMIAALRTIALHEPHRADCPQEACRADTSRTGNRWQRWVAHYGVWSLPVLIPAQFAWGMVALTHHGQERWYPLGFLPGLFVVALMLRYHTRQPCLICASRLPTNGGELAEKRKRWLHLFHRMESAAPIAAMTAWLTSWTLSGHFEGRVLVTLAGLITTGQMILSRVHGRVRPWCPWCRDDGGGEDTDATTPDPSRNAPIPA